MREPRREEFMKQAATTMLIVIAPLMAGAVVAATTVLWFLLVYSPWLLKSFYNAFPEYSVAASIVFLVGGGLALVHHVVAPKRRRSR